MSIGQKLRQVRLEQSLSLDQATQATHIRQHYLEALEADQFDKLPSVAQLRGFLRAYGDYLKLDPEELIHELDQDSAISPGASAFPEPLAIIQPPVTSTDAIFTEVGQMLQAQRELMGLSLEDVERHTHIRLHYIQALEAGDIDHLPSPVQGRGMLSNYATFLGLNTETILLRFADGLQASLYDRQVAKKAPGAGSRPPAEDGKPVRLSQFRRLFSIDLFAGGFLILFLLAFAIWGALHISRLHSDQALSPTAPPVSEILIYTSAVGLSGTATYAPGVTLSAITTQVVSSSLITGTVEIGATETPIVVGPTPGNLSLPIQVYVVAHQRAWMRVTVDGEVVFQERVMPGSAYSFAGNERVELLSGDGSSLQVYFNQQDLGKLGSYGEVVERIFSIEGVQTATPSVPLTSTPVPTSTITPTPTPTLEIPTSSQAITPFP
jgi:cytoskeleton protein RodZ